MRTLLEKPRASQRSNTTKTMIPTRATLGQSRGSDATKGQVVSESSQSGTDDRETSTVAYPSTWAGHNFSQISVYPESTIQRQPEAEDPEDIYEPEAEAIEDIYEPASRTSEGVTKLSPPTTGVCTASLTYIFNEKGVKVATVQKGTQLRVTGYGTPVDSGLDIYDLYYQVEYFGKMSGMWHAGARVDRPIKGYVDASFLDLYGVPLGPSQAMGENDWMTIIPDPYHKGDPDAIAKSALAIEKERKDIEERNFLPVAEGGPKVPREGMMSNKKEDARIQSYILWLKQEDTRPRLATGKDDIRWLAFKKFFDAEGLPSHIMTYDWTNITWGVGFSGSGRGGTGQTEQMMVRLFNQSPASRDALWRAGITVKGLRMVVVKIIDASTGKAHKLWGTMAENYVREQKGLMSLMSNVTIGLHMPGQQSPDEAVRQQNLDAQFETFVNNTLVDSEGIIDQMKPTAAAVAAHSVLSDQHRWSQYEGVTSLEGVRAVIRWRVAQMKASGKYSYVYTLEDIEANIIGTEW